MKGVIVLFLLGIMLISGCTEENEKECRTDSDCVPSTCCHPTGCTPKSNAPDCSEIMCTQECAPGTMDCGQGSCQCIDDECKAVITG